jgi:hypothetical protein
MLTIEYSGAQHLLDALKQLDQGIPAAEVQLARVFDANRFFVDYYCQWKGVNPGNLTQAITCLNRPGWQPDLPVLAALSQGFRQAARDLDLLQGKLNFLKGVDPSGLTYRALAHLPADTPLNSVIHLTIDSFNGGFQYRGEIGLSLLQDITNPDSFGSIVSHELHHAGFRYWADRDPIRQAILSEGSCRSIAVQHVQNLLAEGLANYYYTPIKIDRDKMPAALVDKLEKFIQEDRSLLTQAANVLAASQASGADFADCQRAYDRITIDTEGIEPAGHYIGARMVEIMSQLHPHERIIECVRTLPDFLPLYNQAAGQAGMPVFDPEAVDQFSGMWKNPPLSP